MLCRFVEKTQGALAENGVICLIHDDPLGQSLRDIGVPVTVLSMSSKLPTPRALGALARAISSFKPDVIQTWLYYSDLLGGVAAKRVGGIPVCWGIHHSSFSKNPSELKAWATAKLCARLSEKLPQRIICCSQTSAEMHAKMGYAKDKIEVIPNGFDLMTHKNNSDSRARIRRELGIRESTVVIGIAGRFHPMKDHRSFVNAAGRVLRKVSNVELLMCGKGLDSGNRPLVGWIAEAGIVQHCHLLGLRRDMPDIFASMDIFVSSSMNGEAFPLVIGEAMASEVPCVTTDVGDSAYMVADTGTVVPSSNPAALADALLDLINAGDEMRERMGKRARQRIATLFSIDRTCDAYLDVYRSVLTAKT